MRHVGGRFSELLQATSRLQHLELHLWLEIIHLAEYTPYSLAVVSDQLDFSVNVDTRMVYEYEYRMLIAFSWKLMLLLQ